MTLWTEAAAEQPKTARWPLRRLRAALLRMTDAYDHRAHFMEVPAASQADTGRSREELSGEKSWQPELPFFLQAGYGDNRRGRS